MNEHYFDEMIQSITSVTDRTRTIPLKYTGLNKKGGSTLAYEFEDPETHTRYFLKITPNEDNGGGELRVLPRVNQLFKNEILTEPDALKRLGYIPMPTIITDDPSRFNPEFSGLYHAENSLLQLQTAAAGAHAERELPESLTDRLSILLNFAKLLRTCAKNKIAYVDIKPLEHLFWEKHAGQVRITLIDWGIARANAEPSLMADDIRKFCQTMPEIIYGKKMADLQYKGKLTYPIQDENRKALIPLLSTYSFNSELPPLSTEFAALISDLLSGSLNELRAQNRCVSIWDSIITALDQARLQTQSGNADDHDSTEALNQRASAALTRNEPKDLSTALGPRQLSITSHPAWAAAALRFTQAWYSRIDLIPHIEFDLTVQAIVHQDIPGAESTFERLAGIITTKLGQAQTLPELRQHILTFIDTIRQAIQAWSYLDRYQRKQLTDAQLLSELSTSPLRVSDPILSGLYYGIRSGENPAEQRSEEKKEPAKPAAAADPKTEKISKTENAAKAPAKNTKDAKEPEDPLIENAIRTAKSLKLDADRIENFNMLRPTGFFQRLNDFCINRNAFDNPAVREHLDPLLATIIEKIDLWSQNIRPEKYFVTQDAIDSIDWIQAISPIVYTCPIRYEGREMVLGTIVKARLSEIFQSIYYSLAKEQTAGEPPEILQKIQQIKILRKRLDMENLTYIRSLIDRGEFEAANQVINLHYSESPYSFDQLNNEIAQKRKEQADQKTLAVIDSVLNDLSSNDTKLETARYLNSPKSAAMVSDRFFSFKNRGTQLFDLQDELSRTKSAIQDQRKTIHSMRLISAASLLAALATVVLAGLLLMWSMGRNNELQNSLYLMGTQAAQYQSDNNLMLQAIAQTAAVKPEFPTAVPTAIPTPTMIPTVSQVREEPDIQEEEEPLFIRPTEAPTKAVSAADARLDEMMTREVTLSLNSATRLFKSEGLYDELGSIYNYTQLLTGHLVSYTDTALNLEIPFNIGRSQISGENNTEVTAASNIRQYTTTASESNPIFILRERTSLVAPASECTEIPGQSFCHGTFSIWFDRSVVENNLR